MSVKDARKKQKKLRKEQAKARKAVLKKRYPKIVVRRDGDETAFMEEVAHIVDNFDFSKKACCDSEERLFFHALRLLGMNGIEDFIADGQAGDRDNETGDSELSIDDRLLDTVLFHLGDWIFNQLPARYRENPLPFFYYQALPHENRIEISFDFLAKTPSMNGTIYSSPNSPTVRVDGQDCRVGFFRHAIERACERMSFKPRIDYGDFRLCYRYFRHCMFYEPVELHRGGNAIRLYAPLYAPEHGGATTTTYMEDVANFEADWAANGKYHYVLGYCPVERVDDYAVAKTFLLPGYRGTPEYGLIGRARIQPNKRNRYRETADTLTAGTLLEYKGLQLLRFFHDNGAPQVVRLQQPVLDFAAA